MSGKKAAAKKPSQPSGKKAGGSKPAKGGGGLNVNAPRRLQALVIADSFDEFFRPITLEVPRCLIPVANVPLLNYTIEFLSASGVEEIFVFCCAHAEIIERHVKGLAASGMLPDVTLKCIVSKDSTSVGDALREMYSLNVLQEDFVLVWGDIVSNMKLTKLIDEHTKRREKDKQSLMTVLLTPYREPRTLRDGSGSAVALPGAAVTVKAAAPGTTAITPSEARRAPAKPAAAMSAPKPKSKPADTQPKSTKQSKSLAFDASSSDDETSKDKDEDYGSGFDDSDEDNYGFDGSDGSDDDGDDDDDYDDEVGGESRSARKEADSRRTVAFDGTTNQLLMYTESSGRESLLELDMEVFQTHPKLTFRDDLEDAGVAVCSTEVLFQFQDNFDYETVPQFVKGVVNEEILACKVFAHLDNSGQYIGRVASLRRYQQVSWDILQRWAYPFVPDMNMGMVDTNFTYSRGTLGGAGFYTEKRVHLARSAKIGSDTFHHIESMIGERTQVGANSRISSSIIGRGCRIGANVTIIGSFIWDDAIIGDNVTIMSSMICSNAEIGAGSRLSEGGGGVIVANNVRIPPGVSVPALTKVTVTTKRLDASDDDFGGDDDDDEDDDDDNDDDQDEDKPTKAVPVPVEWATWAINPSTGQPATPSIEINTTVKVFVWHQPTVPFCELITGWEPQLKASLEVEAAKKPTKGQSSMSSDDESGDESFGFNEDFKFDENDKAAAARAAASIAASGAKKMAASPPTTQSPTTTAKKASLLAASSHANPVSAAPATVKSALSAPLRSSGTLKKAASVKPKPKDDFDGDDDDDDIGDVSDIQKFRQEVVKTVGRAVAENHKVDTLTLEINSLKFAYDTNFLDCAASIFDGLMSRVDTAAPVKSIKTILTKWAPIIPKFLMNVEDQTEFIFKMQEYCEGEGKAAFAQAFPNVLMVLYEKDVLAEEAIFDWADEQKEAGEEGEDIELYKKCAKFLAWLKEADEESDDE